MINTDTHLARLLFTTIRLEAHYRDRQPSQGTGFFFLFDQDDESFLVLVTNKHVIQDANEVVFWLHEGTDDQKEPKDSSFSISLRGAGKTRVSDWWIYHPVDDVDLCAIPCATLFDHATKTNKVIYMQAFDKSFIPTEDVLNQLKPFEDILMMGAPIGLWDEVNNLPLTRRGITASHPAVNFKGKPRGVVDIAVLPGSSGSPLLIVDPVNRTISNEEIPEERVILLGIVFATFQFAANGNIEYVDAPTANTSVVNTMIPAHLGLYVKARELLILKKVVIETINKYRAANAG